MKKWDILIIGSGISSLTCALLFLKARKSVCILEKNANFGGYLGVFNRKGYRFDTGAHYVGGLGKEGSFRTLLQYLDVYDDDIFLPLENDGFDIFTFPDMEVRYLKGYEATIKHFMSLFPKEERAIRSYFFKIKEAALSFPTYHFDDRYELSKVKNWLELSLASVVDGLTDDSGLKRAFYCYCALHGVNPQDVSFGFHAIVVDSLLNSAHGFRHGGSGLIDSYIRKIEQLGGELINNAKVNKLAIVNGEVEKVITREGVEYYADWVVSGIHPKNTFEMIDPDVIRPAFKKRLMKVEESSSLFGLFGVCKNPKLFSPLKNYYFFKEEDPRKIISVAEIDKPPKAAFLCVSNRFKADNAKELALTVHCPGPIAWFRPWEESSINKRTDGYRKFKEELSDRLIDFIDEHRPDFKSSFTKFCSSTPLTNLHYNGSCDGTAYGIYHSIKNTGARALGPRTHFRNLLLTGQNTLFPGLLGSAIAGLRTTGHVIGIKDILRNLKFFKEEAPL